LAAFDRRRLLNGGVDANEKLFVGAGMTRQSSSPESSSPIASSDRTELFVGTKDGAKLKEGFVAASFVDGFGVVSEGVSAE
jgi:hypothetical protein